MSKLGSIGSVSLTSSSGQSIRTLTGTSGGPVSYDSNFNVNFAGTNISIVGDPATNTLTFSAGSSIPLSFQTDSGTAVPASNIIQILGTSSQGITTSGASNAVTLNIGTATTAQKGVLLLATNAESIAGVDSSNAITSSSLSAKLGNQTTNGIPIGQGTASALSWTSALTNGQLLIGSTGFSPVLANLTSSGGTITITNGPGSINLDITGGGFSWQVVTGTTQSMTANIGYIANSASLITFTLPATAAVGASVAVTGLGAGQWTIDQNAGQQILSTGAVTTVGVGGSVASTDHYNSVELLCVVANTTWKVTNINGTLTFT